MFNYKKTGFRIDKMSRRDCMSGLLFAVCISVGVKEAIVLPRKRSAKKSIIIDSDYILIDGWLLRADDLFS